MKKARNIAVVPERSAIAVNSRTISVVTLGNLRPAEDFQFIANMLHDAGIHLPASRASLVYLRLAKRLRELRLESFRDYCALVGSAEAADEQSQMVAALTATAPDEATPGVCGMPQAAVDPQ